MSDYDHLPRYVNGYPRRYLLSHTTSMEQTIRAALAAIEAGPADVRLTKASVAVQDALTWVADFYEGVPEAEHYPKPVTPAAVECDFTWVSGDMSNRCTLDRGHAGDHEQHLGGGVLRHPPSAYVSAVLRTERCDNHLMGQLAHCPVCSITELTDALDELDCLVETDRDMVENGANDFAIDCDPKGVVRRVTEALNALKAERDEWKRQCGIGVQTELEARQELQRQVEEAAHYADLYAKTLVRAETAEKVRSGELPKMPLNGTREEMVAFALSVKEPRGFLAGGAIQQERWCCCKHKEFDHRDDGSCVWNNNTGGLQVCACTKFAPEKK